jgi:hypothetical protein
MYIWHGWHSAHSASRAFIVKIRTEQYPERKQRSISNSVPQPQFYGEFKQTEQHKQRGVFPACRSGARMREPPGFGKPIIRGD